MNKKVRKIGATNKVWHNSKQYPHPPHIRVMGTYCLFASSSCAYLVCKENMPRNKYVLHFTSGV